jgi:hypothetical protein
MGIMYTTDAGLIFLDVVDFYVNFIMILIGFCKAFSSGWLYNLQGQLARFGEKIVYVHMATTFGAVFISSILWFGMGGDTILLGFVTFIIIYGGGIFFIVNSIDELILNIPGTVWTRQSALQELFMGNINDLTAELESTVGKIPWMWPFLIKHFIPPVLLTLFVNLAWYDSIDDSCLNFSPHISSLVPLSFIVLNQIWGDLFLVITRVMGHGHFR